MVDSRNIERILYQSLLGPSQMPKATKRKQVRKKREPKPKPDITFRFWDGEGITLDDGTHKYTLLANSDGEYIYDENGLSTIECIKFLLQPRDKKPKDVWFSFGYDVNKILVNVPLRKENELDVSNLQQLWKHNEIYYKGFKIKYIPRKIFSISRGPKERFYSSDCFSFFQTKFTNACSQWKIDVPEIVIQGKADRSIFANYTQQQLIDYNVTELKLAKELITKLYYSLKEAALVPSQWHGPGALAQTFYKHHNINLHFPTEHPFTSDMIFPIRRAYFGGRIDVAAIGEIDCFNYDLISAYPHALTDVISLSNVYWHKNHFPFVDDRHALYHVRWNIPKENKWGPFPWRKPNGCVLFPSDGEGWYWGVEVLAAEKLYPECIKRISAYYPMTPKRYPLKQLIEDAYIKRNEVGRKTGAGIAIKLLLNSLYGKLCQSMGNTTWQNYIWGGYVTAFTRAKMLEAIAQVGDENVVAIATDGIYTKKQLVIETEEKLGTWEYGGPMRVLFVGAGLYTVVKEDGTIGVVKQRGMPSNINHGWVLREWGCKTPIDGIGQDSMVSEYTTFNGMGKAIHQNKKHGVFTEETRNLQDIRLGGTSKRVPPSFYLYASENWKEMPLFIRQRPKTCPMLSTPYTKNFTIIEEMRIENET
jgi:DNA polymerase type B, organellar and viral